MDFIEMVRNSSHSRFILTTREHLLQSARMLSERLARSAILDHRCILELRDRVKPFKNVTLAMIVETFEM